MWKRVAEKEGGKGGKREEKKFKEEKRQNKEKKRDRKRKALPRNQSRRSSMGSSGTVEMNILIWMFIPHRR